MNMPSWEEFSALFENPNSHKVRIAQASLMAHHSAELSSYAQEDYLSLFRSAFKIMHEGAEGIFSLLENLAEHLDPKVFEVEFDDDYEWASVRFEGSRCQFHCPGIHNESFDADLAKLQNLMKDRYVLRLFFEGGIDDELAFLIVPASLWAKAQKHYGSARISANLIPYASQVSLEKPYDATLRWQAPRPKAERLGVGLLLVAVIAVVMAAVLFSIYSPHPPTNAGTVPTCEKMKHAFGKLSPPQAEAMIEDMRQKNRCQ